MLIAWTIGRCFGQISLCTHNSSLEGAGKLNPVPFCSSLHALSDGSIFGRGQNPFPFLAENHGL